MPRRCPLEEPRRNGPLLLYQGAAEEITQAPHTLDAIRLGQLAPTDPSTAKCMKLPREKAILTMRAQRDTARRKPPITCACSRPGGAEARTMLRRRACAWAASNHSPCRCACHGAGVRVWVDGAIVEIVDQLR